MQSLTEKQINVAIAIVRRVAYWRDLPAYQVADLEKQARQLADEIKDKEVSNE